MPAKMDMRGLARMLEKKAIEARAVPNEAARIVAPLLSEAVRDTIGHAPPLQDLAATTQIERARLGYAPNDPLLRTGEYRESVNSFAAAQIAGAGSADPVSPIQEHGNSHIPGRPAFKIGWTLTLPMAVRVARGLAGRMLGKIPH
jgi:hypothetical protein